MTETVDQVTATDTSAVTADQADLRASFAAALGDGPAALTHAALDEIQRIRVESSGRVRITAGAAMLLTLASSAFTALYVRRRAHERAKRLALVAFKAGAVSAALPRARRLAPLGGAGGSLLLASILIGRARRAQAHATPPPAPVQRTHPRELLLGIALGLGAANALARRSRPRK
jgi:hypothetical protein